MPSSEYAGVFSLVHCARASLADSGGADDAAAASVT
jgi:hypothetical protein